MARSLVQAVDHGSVAVPDGPWRCPGRWVAWTAKPRSVDMARAQSSRPHESSVSVHAATLRATSRGATATTLDLRVPHPRHRRPAQRRQVHPVQRPDPQRRARRELPVRHDRAQRRRGAAARPAARGAREDLRLGEDRAGRGVLRRHRRHRQGRVARARGWATSSWPTSASPTRSARSCGCSTIPTSCTSTAASTRRRHRDHQHRADPRRPADAGEGGPAAGEGSADAEGPAAGAGGRAGRRRDPRRRHAPCSARASTSRRCASSRC